MCLELKWVENESSNAQWCVHRIKYWFQGQLRWWGSAFVIKNLTLYKIVIVGFNYLPEQVSNNSSQWFINYCCQLKKNFLYSQISQRTYIISQKNVFWKTLVVSSILPHRTLVALQFIERCHFLLYLHHWPLTTQDKSYERWTSICKYINESSQNA